MRTSPTYDEREQYARALNHREELGFSAQTLQHVAAHASSLEDVHRLLLYPEAEIPAQPADPPTNQTTLKVGGEPFRCECGCNVFTKGDGSLYRCNSCGVEYEGWAGPVVSTTDQPADEFENPHIEPHPYVQGKHANPGQIFVRCAQCGSDKEDPVHVPQAEPVAPVAWQVVRGDDPEATFRSWDTWDEAEKERLTLVIPANWILRPLFAAPVVSGPPPGLIDLTFAELRETNVARANRWHPDGLSGGGWTGADWSNAMCGEAGETANVVKKLRRAETDISGALDAPPAELVEMLADEIADTAIYLDLLAAFYSIDLAEAIARKFNVVSEREGFPERLRALASTADPEPSGMNRCTVRGLGDCQQCRLDLNHGGLHDFRSAVADQEGTEQ